MSYISRSSLIAVVTFSCMIFSGIISIVWLISADGASRFEPAVSGLGLLGGLAGILAERRATARERRQLALRTLVEELRRGTDILADPRFSANGAKPTPRVYPRLPVSATDAALISGALVENFDAGLLGRLHNWRDEVHGFNRRLELTENRIFTAGVSTEIAEFERTLHRSDGYLDQVRRHLQDLQDYLVINYEITSGDPGGQEMNNGPAPQEEPVRSIKSMT